VAVPTDEGAVAVGRRLARELAPTREPGSLSYWEMYASRALRERFPEVGFEGTPEELPASAGERVGLRVTAVDGGGPLAASGLRVGDLLLELGGEPFFRGDGGVAGLRAWLVRELRSEPAPYALEVLRDGASIRLSARLGLGPYPAPAGSPAAEGSER